MSLTAEHTARCGHPELRSGHCDHMTCRNYLGRCLFHNDHAVYSFPMAPMEDCRRPSFVHALAQDTRPDAVLRNARIKVELSTGQVIRIPRCCPAPTPVLLNDGTPSGQRSRIECAACHRQLVTLGWKYWPGHERQSND